MWPSTISTGWALLAHKSNDSELLKFNVSLLQLTVIIKSRPDIILRLYVTK